MSELCKEAVSEARTFCDKFFDTLGLKKDGRDNHIYESMLSSFADIIQRAMEERDKRLGRDGLEEQIDILEDALRDIASVDRNFVAAHGEEGAFNEIIGRAQHALDQSNAERQSAVVTRSSEVDSQS